MLTRLAGLLIAAALVAGCGSGIPGSPASPASPAAAASATADAPTPAELQAIAFRRTYGLDADLEHVRKVAANPRASSDEYGVPLTPEEVLVLHVRGDSDEVRRVVSVRAEQYPDDHCGNYIDRDNGGAFTSMWRANLEGHMAAILFQVGPDANVAFVGCTYSAAELDRVADLLSEDRDWMREIPAVPMSWGPNTLDNRVEMEISSAVPEAADLVRRHYEKTLALPAGILVVTSDGTGAALRPRGTLLITVVRPNGDPVGPNDLMLNWGSIDLPGLRCGVGDMGYGVRADGKATELPCQEGEWRIVVEGIPADGEEWEVYGEGRVSVHGGETSRLKITLDREPPEPAG